MNYELAKELKDAGFPQKNPRAIPKDSGRIDGDGNLHLAQEPVYIPTLSELIAECGDELVSINKEVGVAFGGKPCFTGRWHALGQLIKAKGDTPEEAVARLYLLNKKP